MSEKQKTLFGKARPRQQTADSLAPSGNAPFDFDSTTPLVTDNSLVSLSSLAPSDPSNYRQDENLSSSMPGRRRLDQQSQNTFNSSFSSPGNYAETATADRELQPFFMNSLGKAPNRRVDALKSLSPLSPLSQLHVEPVEDYQFEEVPRMTKTQARRQQAQAAASKMMMMEEKVRPLQMTEKGPQPTGVPKGDVRNLQSGDIQLMDEYVRQTARDPINFPDIFDYNNAPEVAVIVEKIERTKAAARGQGKPSDKDISEFINFIKRIIPDYYQYIINKDGTLPIPRPRPRPLGLDPQTRARYASIQEQIDREGYGPRTLFPIKSNHELEEEVRKGQLTGERVQKYLLSLLQIGLELGAYSQEEYDDALSVSENDQIPVNQLLDLAKPAIQIYNDWVISGGVLAPEQRKPGSSETERRKQAAAEPEFLSAAQREKERVRIKAEKAAAEPEFLSAAQREKERVRIKAEKAAAEEAAVLTSSQRFKEAAAESEFFSAAQRERIKAAKAAEAAATVLTSSQRSKKDVVSGRDPVTVSTSSERYEKKQQLAKASRDATLGDADFLDAERIADDPNQNLATLLESSHRISTIPPPPPQEEVPPRAETGFFARLFGKGGKNTHHHRKKSKSALSRKNSKRYSVKAKRRNRRKSRR